MWSIQKLVTVPVFPNSSWTAFKVKGRKKRSILRELVAGFEEGGTAYKGTNMLVNKNQG